MGKESLPSKEKKEGYCRQKRPNTQEEMSEGAWQGQGTEGKTKQSKTKQGQMQEWKH